MLGGISTYTYTWAFGVPGSEPPNPMSVRTLIDKAAAYKLDCIQIADNFPLERQHQDNLIAIRNYAGLMGIGIEVGGRGLTEENLDRLIDLAGFFSSPILRMVIDRQEYMPDAGTVISVIRNSLKKLSSGGITLALENHDRLHSSIFRTIVDQVDSEYAGICLDCVNSMGIGEGIDSVMENLAPYTVNLHVKDYIVKRVSHLMGFVVEGVPAGKGFLHLPVILEKLKPYNKCRSAILELWTPPAASVQETIEREDSWAAESIDYLKKLII